MSEALEALQSKLNSAHELQSVVRTMKALSAANIAQYEKTVCSLAEYHRTVELALAAYFREREPVLPGFVSKPCPPYNLGAVVFGSDQGLVGRFNDVLADYLFNQLPSVSENNVFWAVGERMSSRLEDGGLRAVKTLMVPNSLSAITPLVSELLEEVEERRESSGMHRVLVFHNQPGAGASYQPMHRVLLPIDQHSVIEWSRIPWPTRLRPEVLGYGETSLLSLIREHLFVLLFRACAESLASENASRLAAMQRAERNIGELMENLKREFNQTRQASIDEELADVLAGFEALSQTETRKQAGGNEKPFSLEARPIQGQD